jgi:ribosomal protein L12E/L44/L45/RPP1/RPP2
VVGAVDGAIALTLTGASPNVVLTLRQQGPARPVSVGVTPFRSSGGDTYRTLAVPATVQFSGGLATVTLAADLPFGGPYSAQLSIGEGATATRVTVSATRTRGAAPFTVDGVATTAGVSKGMHWQSVTRTVAVTETTGRQLVLQPPVVVAPSASSAGQTVEANVRLKAVRLIGSTNGCHLSRQQQMTVSAGQICQLALDLAVPAAAGSYAATIRFSALGYAPVDQAATVQLSRPWWWALLAVALGVLLAAGVRLWWGPRTGAISRRIEVARAREDLETAIRNLPQGLNDDERAVVDELGTVLDKADGAARRNDADATARLTSVRGQITAFPAWVDLHRVWETADDAIRESHQSEWQDLTERMTAADPDAAKAGSLLDDLKKFRDMLADDSRQRTAQRAERLQQALEGLALDSDTLAKVRGRIERASDEAKLSHGDAAQARAEIDAAEQEVADALTVRLRTFLMQDESQLGFSAPTGWWPNLQATMQRRLDSAQQAGEDRLGLLTAIDADTLREVAGKFGQELQRQRAGLNLKSPGDRDVDELMGHAQDSLGRVSAALDKRDLTAAHTAYDEARQQMQALAEKAKHLGQAQPTLTAPALPHGAGALGPMPTGAVTVPASLAQAHVRPPLSKLTMELRINNWLLFAVSLVVAVLTGWVVLYVGKPTWGGVGDIIGAVLWGLGITAAAGGVTGFAAVRQSLTA